MNALLIFDMQNDFMSSGSFPLLGVEEIIEPMQKLASKFSWIYAVQDCHPADHVSFALNHGRRPGEEMALSYGVQKLHPVHCVKGSFGAEITAALSSVSVKKTFYKCLQKVVDSISAFIDAKGKKATSIDQELKKRRIDTLSFSGIGADSSIKESMIDAAGLGYLCYLVTDVSRPRDKDAYRENRLLRELNGYGIQGVLSHQAPVN